MPEMDAQSLGVSAGNWASFPNRAFAASCLSESALEAGQVPGESATWWMLFGRPITGDYVEALRTCEMWDKMSGEIEKAIISCVSVGQSWTQVGGVMGLLQVSGSNNEAEKSFSCLSGFGVGLYLKWDVLAECAQSETWFIAAFGTRNQGQSGCCLTMSRLMSCCCGWNWKLFIPIMFQPFFSFSRQLKGNNESGCFLVKTVAVGGVNEVVTKAVGKRCKYLVMNWDENKRANQKETFGSSFSNVVQVEKNKIKKKEIVWWHEKEVRGTKA
jgi:hypothetical protein